MKKVVNIEQHSLKELAKLPLEILKISTEKVIRKLPKKELCSWLAFLPRAVSWDVLNQIIEEVNNEWEEIEEKDLDSFSGIDNLELGKPKLILLKGGKR